MSWINGTIAVIVVCFLILAILVFNFFPIWRKQRREYKESEKLAHQKDCKCVACKLLPK